MNIFIVLTIYDDILGIFQFLEDAMEFGDRRIRDDGRFVRVEEWPIGATVYNACWSRFENTGWRKTV